MQIQKKGDFTIHTSLKCKTKIVRGRKALPKVKTLNKRKSYSKTPKIAKNWYFNNKGLEVSCIQKRIYLQDRKEKGILPRKAINYKKSCSFISSCQKSKPTYFQACMFSVLLVPCPTFSSVSESMLESHFDHDWPLEPMKYAC